MLAVLAQLPVRNDIEKHMPVTVTQVSARTGAGAAGRTATNTAYLKGMADLDRER